MGQGNIKSSLLMSKEVDLDNGLQFSQPLVKEITSVGYYNFIKDIYIFYNPKDIYLESKDVYDYFEDNNMDNYAALSYILDIGTGDDEIFKAIKTFFKNHFKNDISIKSGKIYIDDDIMTPKVYNEICTVLKLCYGFDERLDDIDYDPYAKTFKINLIRSRRKKAKKNKKEDNDAYEDLHKVLSIVSTRKEPSEINKMTMYQLLSYYKTINSEKMHDAMLHGIYNGKIDGTKYKNIWAE